tara:strand:- start:17601 stop:18674 length:1074 start_codon:yes stop_codon:yes gene_type:complete
MNKINVNLNDFSYTVSVGNNLLNKENLNKLIGKEVLIVIDSSLSTKYEELLTEILLPECIRLEVLKIKASEQNKNQKTLNKIYDKLIEANFSRETVLVGLGGGIICDMTGFAAATYQRGINFLLFPTTLLAQVDASVGGKTAINHPEGKNMIGAFHQPCEVIADIDFLASLQQKELSAGLSEVIKHSLIHDYQFFQYLENNIESILIQHKDITIESVARSIEIKSEIVSKDEKDIGIRRILNFGHTFGHALEVYGNFEKYSHGEAVSLGMLMALNLSNRELELPSEFIDRVKSVLRLSKNIIEPKEDIDALELFKLMANDKKKTGNSLNFILLDRLGSAKVVNGIDDQNIIKAIDSF